jgi:hypothetical protein
MKKLMFIMGILVVLGLLFMSCDDNKDDNSTNNNNNQGTGNITVNVSSGVNPQYSWSGGNLFSVSVVRQSDPTTVVWGCTTPGSDGIASPVTHGTLPPGSIQTSIMNTENTLTAGVAYRVSVSRINGSDFGYTDFTP